jgi:hypothetical protein
MKIYFNLYLNLSYILVQALLEAIGSSGSSGQEAVTNAEISAAIWIARAGAQDSSAIPSICQVSAALEYTAGGEYTIIVHVLKVSFLVHNPVLP